MEGRFGDTGRFDSASEDVLEWGKGLKLERLGGADLGAGEAFTWFVGMYPGEENLSTASKKLNRKKGK